MDKIKGQLAGVAALLGVIAAIGGGFVKYGEVMTKLEVLEEKVNKLENADTSHSHKVADHTHDTEHSHTVSQINKKEIELLKVQIEEIKVSTKNPLSN